MTGAEQRTILVVDDEVEICEALCFDLDLAGYKTLTAHSGAAAIKLLQESKVDLLISDIRMPNGTGMDVLAAVKAKSHDEPFVLLASGFSDVKTEDAFDLGAEALLTKPFRIELLLDVIKKRFTPREEVWLKPAAAPAKAAVQVAHLGLSVESPASLQGSSTVRIGRGGVSLLMDCEAPPNGAEASFTVAFTDGVSPPFTGLGIVRWRSRVGTTQNRVGVEFKTLADSSLALVLEHLRRTKPRAFIPK